MALSGEQFELRVPLVGDQAPWAAEPLRLCVTLDVAGGCFRFEWLRSGSEEPIARGRLSPGHAGLFFPLFALELEVETANGKERDQCGTRGTSATALVNRLRKRFPVPDDALQVCVLSDSDLGPAKAGAAHTLELPAGKPAWKWLGHEVRRFGSFLVVATEILGDESPERGSTTARTLARSWLGLPADVMPGCLTPELLPSAGDTALRLEATLDVIQGFIQCDWRETRGRRSAAMGRIRCTGSDELTWEMWVEGQHETSTSTHHLNSIRAKLKLWLARFPTSPETFVAFRVQPQRHSPKPLYVQEPPFGPGESPWAWLADSIQAMAHAARIKFSPLARAVSELDPLTLAEMEWEERRYRRKEQKRAEEEARREETMARLAEERRKREQRAAEERKVAEAKRAAESLKSLSHPSKPAAERPALPPVPTHLEAPRLEFQETTFALADLRSYALRERAALWWISNQSDDLLCLPYCRLERLDYQLRTALRVLGPLRGRALLSDEVGLGKTIEAGLVLKELLTRGMVKRFLVLTVPSLVDQWEEELNDKFGLVTVTTNHAAARDDAEQFWRESPQLVASLHTLKQPAQLEIARQVHWDMLIVDEAHYLRNRESQAWQAVNALPRQFLLLLTATPVQNSLEELYNLVTLLQPGQLPTPKEFRARFIDPKRPRQPREPEELRRLLGQVMIRNTRANAGVRLPPRRAETVSFEPDEAERSFWAQWESEFRACLGRLSASQASLWGRLLLQAAGSSPAAWREGLKKFPDQSAARAWGELAPLEASWQRKCELLQPLTRGQGGAVIFSQFLQTQAALAEHLRRAGVETFVINGATPPAERQPISEEFRARGGALLLTHSGTEGRNLQFCHRLANFDLPWNPMEIEQRIGRLHRLGQRHPVHIYNFIQAGTLQEHLLQILQEKLNLFELVVGETGLVLGERFSSDEFAEEVLHRWRESEGRVAEALAGLGNELAAARAAYGEVKQLDQTLFEQDYESL
jgi:superfamily II DNA or RNA helicase